MNMQRSPMKAILASTFGALLLLTACGSDADLVLQETEAATTLEEPTTTADQPTTTADQPTTTAAPVTEPATEPVSETSEDTISIETKLTPEGAGTFVVEQGAELLGCSSGSVVEAIGFPRVTNTFTCEEGDREGTFTLLFTIVEESEGPGDFNGPWRVLDTSGDFAGLTGDGPWSGVMEGETSLGSFPGILEFDPAKPASTDADSVLIADVAAYSAAFGAGDFDLVWSMVSPRCRDLLPETGHRDSVAFFAEEAPDLTASNITAVVNGDTAAVNYIISLDDFSYVAQPWALSDRSWHWDAC